MFLKHFTKQRRAKQFHYMPRYGNDKKFDLIYRSIGRMAYAESYADKRYDEKRFINNEESSNPDNAETTKRIQFQRSNRHQYNSTKTLLLILGALVILVLALFGFDLTLFTAS
ncbi:MAG: hypothetical protein ACK5MD_06280 [Flavobacteriales bacterium]